MAEYFEEEASLPEDRPDDDGVRRKRVRRKRKRSGGPPANAAAAAETKKSRRGDGRKVKKEAIARLDLSGRHKLNTVQVLWVIISGTVFFFAVGIISLDLIFNQDQPGEVTESEGSRAEVVPWAESIPESVEDEAGVPQSTSGIPTIADFESSGNEAPDRPKTDQAYTLDIPKAESGIEQQRDNLITQAYENRLYDQAIELGREELERRPSSPTVRYRLALAYRENGQPQKAIEMFQEQLKRSEDSSVQILCLIELAKLAESGEGETAPLDYFDRAMGIDSGHPALLKEFSLYLRRNQRYQEGYYQTRRELARITPDDLATTRLKLAALQADLFDPFRESHEKEVKREDKSAYAFMTEAGRLMVKGENEKAVEAIRQARLKLGDQTTPFYAMVSDPIFQPVHSEFLDVPVRDGKEKKGIKGNKGENPESSGGISEPSPALPPSIGSFDLEMPEDLTPLDQ